MHVLNACSIRTNHFEMALRQRAIKSTTESITLAACENHVTVGNGADHFISFSRALNVCISGNGFLSMQTSHGQYLRIEND